MAKSVKTKLVSSAKFGNTSKGATNRVGDFIKERDEEGNTLYTRNLRVTSTQLDRTFPTVITADKVAEIVSTSLTKKQPLKVVDGVDYRLVEAPYIGKTWHLGYSDFPLRMAVPAVVSFVMTGLVVVFMSRTFMGKAIQAVSQDRLALQLMGADPIKVKRIALCIGIATAAVAGALLIIIQPVEPSVGRLYIGRVFAIVVLGGMGSIPGMFVAALLIGVVESFIATFYGPSWAPAVGDGILLLTLAIRPQGLFGRA